MEYKITLNEKQMHIVKDALELRFRIDLLQDDMLAEILATMNDLDLSPDNPEHKRIFDAYIYRRSHLSAVIQAAFEIASPWSVRTSEFRRRGKDSLIAEDIWQAMRYCLWANNPDKDKMGYIVDSRPPLQVGKEPIPKVEVVEDVQRNTTNKKVRK